MKPAAARMGYSKVFTAFRLIVKREGPAGLMAGATPTMTRAMALNFGMLAFNASSKDFLSEQGVTGAPLVFVKTQMQKQKPDPKTGELQFKSALDCAAKT